MANTDSTNFVYNSTTLGDRMTEEFGKSPEQSPAGFNKEIFSYNVDNVNKTDVAAHHIIPHQVFDNAGYAGLRHD